MPRRFLQSLGRLARQGRAVDPVAFRLPSFPRGVQHCAFAGPRQAHHGACAPAPRYGDGIPLLVRQTRPTAWLAPGESRVLTPDRGLDVPPADAMRARRVHPLRRPRHAALDLDHLAGEVPPQRPSVPAEAQPAPETP